MVLITRDFYINKINELILSNPIVALMGPRQVGKTTLAREIANYYQLTTFFDLENPDHYLRLNDPLLALSSLRGLVIIDEIQHKPALFKVLRVLVDRPEQPCKFLILGSASPTLSKQSSESLAGRIAYVDISGFTLQEVGEKNLETLWLRGGFPRSYLAMTEKQSVVWRQDFMRSFLERDLPLLGIKIPSMTLRRFLMMLAHYHAQLWNGAELARAFGMSEMSIRHYLDIFIGTFMVRQLTPWWENISKRQVKTPKIYLADTGMLHTLLDLNTYEDLQNHPKVGASWEGFAIECILTQLNIRPEHAFFWRTHNGLELDLMILRGNQRIGFEIKRSTTPSVTKALYIAAEDLKLNHIYIVHAGVDTYPLATNITALSLQRILLDLPSGD